jgi:hypothetical protein
VSNYGTKSFASIQPGKNAFHGFTTRQAQLPAGVVTVTAKATIDGQQVQATETASYDARRCG